MSEKERLNGSVCVIGGAASAIGRAVAERLAGEGALVVGLDAVAHGTGSIAITVDLRDEGCVRETFARIKKDMGRIDFLYNNAGLVSSGDTSVLETPSEVLEQVWSANFRTAWLCCKYAVPHMLANKPYQRLGGELQFFSCRDGFGHGANVVQRGQSGCGADEP